MINNVTLIGRLTRDAELRYTPNNIATAQFNIACNRNFKNANDEYDADFINCVMWREQAERFCNWTRKGMLVGIVGRIQTRSYENQQGQRVVLLAQSFMPAQEIEVFPQWFSASADGTYLVTPAWTFSSPNANTMLLRRFKGL